MEQIELNIVDDPANALVFKGPGHYPAVRAESAIRKLEGVFPQLRFEVTFGHQLASLRATAVVAIAINPDDFIAALSEALASTGTRMAPIKRYGVALLDAYAIDRVPCARE